MSPVRSHSPEHGGRACARGGSSSTARSVSPLISRWPTAPGRDRRARRRPPAAPRSPGHAARSTPRRASPGRLAMKSCSASVEPTTSSSSMAEARLPRVEERGGQRLARGHAEPQRREIEAPLGVRAPAACGRRAWAPRRTRSAARRCDQLEGALGRRGARAPAPTRRPRAPGSRASCRGRTRSGASRPRRSTSSAPSAEDAPPDQLGRGNEVVVQVHGGLRRARSSPRCSPSSATSSRLVSAARPARAGARRAASLVVERAAARPPDDDHRARATGTRAERRGSRSAAASPRPRRRGRGCRSRRNAYSSALQRRAHGHGTAPSFIAPQKAAANAGRSGSASSTRCSISTPRAGSALPSRLARRPRPPRR